MRRPHCISVGLFNFTVVLDLHVREHRSINKTLREELLGQGVAFFSSDFVGRFFQTGAVRSRVERDEGKVRRAGAERDITDFFGSGLVERAGVFSRVPVVLFFVLMASPLCPTLSRARDSVPKAGELVPPPVAPPSRRHRRGTRHTPPPRHRRD